jgi:hypothetical protein
VGEVLSILTFHVVDNPGGRAFSSQTRPSPEQSSLGVTASMSVEKAVTLSSKHETKAVLPWTSHPLEMLPREDREPYKEGEVDVCKQVTRCACF